jgi:hypothetical protein
MNGIARSTISIDALVRQANRNIRAVHATQNVPADCDLNAWLMQESTGRDYPLSDCGPVRPINDQHEKPTVLSPEVWEGIMLGLMLTGVLGLIALVLHFAPSIDAWRP